MFPVLLTYFSLLVLIWGAWLWTQSLMPARQMLYPEFHSQPLSVFFKQLCGRLVYIP
jgi:hypothetical protein